MRSKSSVLMTAVLASMLAVPLPVSAKTYNVDPQHTSVTFKVRHLFTSVVGRFERFEGKIEFDQSDPQQTKVSGSIKAASINTNVAKRDQHLRSPDFFNAQKYPRITFVARKVLRVDPGKKKGRLQGELTIHGVTRPIVLDVEFLGEGNDPWGNTRAGFHATTKLNRKDFGLTWNEVLETGGMLVGDEIEIELSIEALPAE